MAEPTSRDTTPAGGEQTAAPAGPRSATEMFVAFTQIALQSFGGALAMLEREIVQRRRWMTPKDFLGVYAISQVMPGPTGISFCVLLGDRHFGMRGVIAALAGFVAVPAVLVLAITALFHNLQHHPWMQGALHGMGAASVGLIVHTAWRMARALKGSRRGVVIALSTLGVVSVAHWPVSAVVLTFGVGSVALAWREIARRPEGRHG
jgi:chromate transporter